MKSKLTLLAIGSALLLIGCYEGHQHGSADGTSGYAGSSGNAEYPYVYYPDAEVYYQPQRRVYYWSEGGARRSGEHVPWSGSA
jgi:hypothetical protein